MDWTIDSFWKYVLYSVRIVRNSIESFGMELEIWILRIMLTVSVKLLDKCVDFNIRNITCGNNLVHKVETSKLKLYSGVVDHLILCGKLTADLKPFVFE